MTARLTTRGMLAVVHAGHVLAMQSVSTEAAHDALEATRAALRHAHIHGNTPDAWAARRRLAEAAIKGVAA